MLNAAPQSTTSTNAEPNNKLLTHGRITKTNNLYSYENWTAPRQVRPALKPRSDYPAKIYIINIFHSPLF